MKTVTLNYAGIKEAKRLSKEVVKERLKARSIYEQHLSDIKDDYDKKMSELCNNKKYIE